MRPMLPSAGVRAAVAAAMIGIVVAFSSHAGATDASSARTAATGAGAVDASRVVAIGGAVTEILYALGLADRIVAVDTTSVFPERALKDKPNVGYMRALSPEGVLALDPTLILAVDGAGPPDAVSVLKGASIAFVAIPPAQDEKGVLARIRAVAKIMGVEARGEDLAAAVAADFAALEKLRAHIQAPRKVVFVLSASGGAPVVGGAHSTADAILKLAGAVNAMAGIEGYKPAVDEAMLAAEPEALVLMRNGPAGHGLPDEALLALPAFKGTPVAASRRIIRVDGQYALGFGPRTPQAARDLAAAIYPDLALPELPSRTWAPAAAAPARGNGG